MFWVPRAKADAARYPPRIRFAAQAEEVALPGSGWFDSPGQEWLEAAGYALAAGGSPQNRYRVAAGAAGKMARISLPQRVPVESEYPELLAQGSPPEEPLEPASKPAAERTARPAPMREAPQGAPKLAPAGALHEKVGLPGTRTVWPACVEGSGSARHRPTPPS